MQCEVCGRKIYGSPIRAIIESAQMTVCPKCEKLSSGYWEPKPQPRVRKSIILQPIQPIRKRKQHATVSETVELVNDLPQLVRKSREKLGMSHEDLGKKTREKVSVLRKIEIGKMVPDLALAEKLEHALKITLRVPAKDPEAQISSPSRPSGTTLGDLIQFKLKKEGAKK